MVSATPLAGIVVVELGHSVAAPYAGMILADLGADVIKVENPDKGDHARGWGPPWWHGTASAYQALNRNKFGITVDLGDAAAAEKLRALILERADVVLQNLRAGVAERYGLGADQLRAQKPSLICCNLGAFGTSGPLRDKPGYDPLMQAFGGLMSVTGEEGRPPVRVGVSMVDLTAGLWTALGIISALYERRGTRTGGTIDTSLYETMLAFMTVPIAGHLASGEIRGRNGSGVAEIVPYQVFSARDGYLMIAAGNDNLFRRMAEALGHAAWGSDPRFVTNGDRVANRAVLIQMIEDVVGTKDRAHWMQKLDAVGVPSAPIQHTGEVVAHAQTRALEMIQPSPDGALSLVGLPLSFDGARPPHRRRPPTQGEHNDEILGG
ncbi:MAG: CoA transferase [Alphaproteobacteria bacterium]|nr:CoA transferase [Alphaproteobacteria bacterium]